MSSLDKLPTTVAIIIVVSMLAALGGIVLYDTATTTETTVAVVNDSITFDANAGVSLTTASADTYFVFLTPAQNLSVTATNGTAQVFLNSANTYGNFTVHPNGSVYCGSVFYMNCTGGIYNLSYSYQQGGPDHDVLTDGTNATSEVADWLDIIALVVAATVLLAGVLMVLSLAQSRR